MHIPLCLDHIPSKMVIQLKKKERRKSPIEQIYKGRVKSGLTLKLIRKSLEKNSFFLQVIRLIED
jgi:hypothetical protein